MASETSEAEKARIRALYEEGLSYRKIGRRVGRSYSTIRYICDPTVRVQQAKQKAKYYAENKKKVLAQAARYYEKNSEERKAYHAKYYAENREKIRIYDAKRYADNKEKVLAQVARYYKENKEKIAIQDAEYQRSPRGRAVKRSKDHRRRELKQHGDGFTLREYEQMWQEQEGKCAYCGCDMIRWEDVEGTIWEEKGQYEDNYCNIDHVIPLSEGGLHESSNVVLACHKCNMEKGAETWEPNEEVLCGSN